MPGHLQMNALVAKKGTPRPGEVNRLDTSYSSQEEEEQG